MFRREPTAFDHIFEELFKDPKNMITKVQTNKYHAMTILKSALILRLEDIVNWFLAHRPDVFLTGPMLDYAIQGGDLYLVELVHENFKNIKLDGFGLVTAIENEDFDVVEWLVLVRPSDFNPNFVVNIAERCDDYLGYNDEPRVDVLMRIFHKFLRPT